MTDSFKTAPLSVAPDHPAFAGHFPGHPIVPGALLLDEALLCLARAEGLDVAQVDVAVAKFQRPVRPGEGLTLSYRLMGPGRYALEVLVGAADALAHADAATAGGQVAAAATLTVRAPQANTPLAAVHQEGR
jgi:3-hydroxyacyl-[acyl-carrier-protein] dehydratase